MLTQHFLKERGRVIGLARSPATIEHPNYRHFAADVANVAAVEAAFETVRREYGKVDVLVNNAGIANFQLTVFTPMSAAEEVLRTNFLGAFLVSREAVKLMLPKKYGRIINITSMAVPFAPVGGGIYSASKSALTEFTRTLAKEVAGSNITCNLLGVSAIETGMHETMSREKLDDLIRTLPLNRPATIEDITNAVDFFASRESAYITAQILYLGGVY